MTGLAPSVELVEMQQGWARAELVDKVKVRFGGRGGANDVGQGDDGLPGLDAQGSSPYTGGRPLQVFGLGPCFRRRLNGLYGWRPLSRISVN